MKTINIKGKPYIMVNERLKEFRNNYKGYSLTSEIVELTDNACTIKAIIKDDKDKILATGLAREVVGKTPINKFAFVENAETSAWGRALGNFGIGIDEAICTAEELNYKIAHDEDEDMPEKNLTNDQANLIACCTSKEELIKVCRQLKAELGQDYHRAITRAYKDRLAEVEK